MGPVSRGQDPLREGHWGPLTGALPDAPSPLTPSLAAYPVPVAHTPGSSSPETCKGKPQALSSHALPTGLPRPVCKALASKPRPTMQTVGQAPEREKTCPDQKLLLQPGLLQHVGLCLQGQAQCCEGMGSQEEVPASRLRTMVRGEDKGRAGTEPLWLTGMELMTGLGSQLKYKALHCGDEATEAVSLGPCSQAWDQAPQHDGEHCQEQADGTSPPSPLQGVSSDIWADGTRHPPSPLCMAAALA